jgi:hypothetical protein
MRTIEDQITSSILDPAPSHFALDPYSARSSQCTWS